MRITFRRFPDHSRAWSVIERDDGVVYRMAEFTGGGTELPHDLRHFVVERELGIADGIWGGIAAGMVYTSMAHVRGRRPPHSAERSDELKRAQRQRIMRAELFANVVEAIAMLADPSEADGQRPPVAVEQQHLPLRVIPHVDAPRVAGQAHRDDRVRAAGTRQPEPSLTWPD
jgi:hypothetical protein